ncbi:MAG: hypothetical protein L0G22_08355 [Propionibacteriaceae bacterium]|nr:hypothetical protein [Propionibacteriaceae bacterium]
MRQLAHAALALAGVLAVVWALTLAVDPVITCRESVMRPGDVCAHSGGGRSQTYEERFEAAQQARPVVGGVGALVAVFGAGLLVAERRRSATR